MPLGPLGPIQLIVQSMVLLEVKLKIHHKNFCTAAKAVATLSPSVSKQRASKLASIVLQ
jgi:hypothetical protein